MPKLGSLGKKVSGLKAISRFFFFLLSNRKATLLLGQRTAAAATGFEDLFLRRGKSQVGNMTTNIFSLLLEAKIQITELFSEQRMKRAEI